MLREQVDALDEPTTGLDKEIRALVWKAIIELAKTKLVIVITHDKDAPRLETDTVISCS